MSKNANGENTIFYDKTKKKYKGQIVIGYYDNGRVKRKSVFGNTKTEVRDKLKHIELDILNGNFTDESNVTIYHLAKQMQDDKLNYNEIKKSTYNRNLETLKRLQPIYNTPLQQATETQIRSFLLNQQNYSQSTINKVYGMLTATFKEAQKRKIIVDNLMDNIRRPKTKQIKEDVRALTIDEQNKLMLLLKDDKIKYSTQMLISMLTGMRMGEINALKKSSVNLQFDFISVDRTISKGEKGEALLSETTKTYAGKRKIPLTTDIKRIFEELLEVTENGFIFKTDNGGMVTTNQVNLELKRALKKYDIIDKSVAGKVSCHSLRHTYATRCIEAGMQPKVLQELLGHKNIQITLNTYCNAFDKYQADNIAKVNDYLKNLGLTISA